MDNKTNEMFERKERKCQRGGIDISITVMQTVPTGNSIYEEMRRKKEEDTSRWKRSGDSDELMYVLALSHSFFSGFILDRAISAI